MATGNMCSFQLDQYRSPYLYHVCILHAEADGHLVNQLCNNMWNNIKREINICKNITGDIQTIRRIVYGSVKVIFFLTDNYEGFKVTGLHRQAAEEKAKELYGNDDIAVVVKKEATLEISELEELLEEHKLDSFNKHVFQCMDVTSETIAEKLEKFLVGPPASIRPENPLRDSLPTHMGISAALFYFHGYLSIKIPEISKKLTVDLLFEDKRRIMPKSFLIIIPQSLRCPPILQELDERIVSKKKGIELKINRGGLPERDFTTAIHHMNTSKQQGDNKEPTKLYQFIGEVPNILVNLWDMEMRGISAIYNKKAVFIHQFYMKLCQLVQSEGCCKGKVSFVFYKDEEDHLSRKDNFFDILQKVIEEEITKDEAEETKQKPSSGEQPMPKGRSYTISPSICVETDDMKEYNLSAGNVVPTLGRPGYIPVKTCKASSSMSTGELGEDDSLTAMAQELSAGKVGPAYIINNRSLTDDDKREEKLKAMAEKLNFVVQPVKRDAKAKQIYELGVCANEFTLDDGRNPGAIFCAFIGYGNRHGMLLDADEKPWDFSKLTDNLMIGAMKDVPKVFVVEASERKGPGLHDDISDEHLARANSIVSLRDKSIEEKKKYFMERRQSREDIALVHSLFPSAMHSICLYSGVPGSGGTDANLHCTNFINNLTDEMVKGEDVQKVFNRVINKMSIARTKLELENDESGIFQEFGVSRHMSTNESTPLPSVVSRLTKTLRL